LEKSTLTSRFDVSDQHRSFVFKSEAEKNPVN